MKEKVIKTQWLPISWLTNARFVIFEVFYWKLINYKSDILIKAGTNMYNKDKMRNQQNFIHISYDAGTTKGSKIMEGMTSYFLDW